MAYGERYSVTPDVLTRSAVGACGEGLQPNSSLAILEHDPPRIDGMEVCRAIRQQETDREHQLPVVMVAAQEDQTAGAVAGVTDWLIKAFNDAYARTKIRPWTFRAACQWMKEGIPDDDERRLARAPMQ